MEHQLDADAELSLAEAAQLCGCSTRTLTRDHEDASVALSFIKRDGHNFVRVGDLIAAKRYVPGSEPAWQRTQRDQLADRCARLEREVGELRTQTALLQVRLNDAQQHSKTIERLALSMRGAA
jgi:hypothetical protein